MSVMSISRDCKLSHDPLIFSETICVHDVKCRAWKGYKVIHVCISTTPKACISMQENKPLRHTYNPKTC